MTGARRKAMVASVLALAGTAVGVPMIVSGTASAETNSRLCGRYWVSEDPETHRKEVLTVLHKMTKKAKSSCDKAAEHHQLESPPAYLASEFIRTPLGGWQSTERFTKIVCEEWSPRPTERGGIGEMAINAYLDNAPGELRTGDRDICTTMRYSSKSRLRPYWMHWDSAYPDVVRFMSGDYKQPGT